MRVKMPLKQAWEALKGSRSYRFRVICQCHQCRPVSLWTLTSKHYRSIFKFIGHLLDDDSHAHEIAVYIELTSAVLSGSASAWQADRAGEARYPVRHDSGIAACTGLCVGGCVVSAQSSEHVR